MSLALPLALLLPGLRPASPAAQAEPPIDDNPAEEVVAMLRSELARALLGDAMLSLDDLPDGWVRDDSGESGSLFTGTEYEPLFIADLQVRFCRPETGESLDQHVGVLPQWVIRHFAEELERVAEGHGVSPAATHQRPSRRDLPPVGDQRLALEVAPREGPLPGVEAVFLRRGTAVMAIAHWQSPRPRLEATRMASLAITADDRLAAIADALR